MQEIGADQLVVVMKLLQWKRSEGVESFGRTYMTIDKQKDHMGQAKSFDISKNVTMKAYERVKANTGSEGIDGIMINEFEENLKDNLYKIWNRMSSGTYFPPQVRTVEIPKADGKKRKLGIPTVGDRVAQMVVKMYLEPEMDEKFDQSSYGYRPNKSAKDAIGAARRKCWEYDWFIDLDIIRFLFPLFAVFSLEPYSIALILLKGQYCE